MKKAKPLLLACVFIGGIFFSCSKEISSPKAVGQNQSGNNLQSLFFQNITIDSSQNYTFIIPEITQSVIQNGSVKVYAVYAVEQEMQWQQLPIINSCSSRLDIGSVSAGHLTIQNNLGSATTMSYRFDIFSDNSSAQ